MMRPQPDFIHEFVPGSSARTLLLLHGTGGNERDLRRLCLEALRCARERAIVFRQFAGGEWKPRDEAEIFASAILQHVLGISIDQVVSVLDRNDWRDAPDCFDLLYADFRQSDMANFALALKIDQRADLIFHCYFRIDPVQL